jgi:Ca2+-binding RTX toxin-like protein
VLVGVSLLLGAPAPAFGSFVSLTSGDLEFNAGTGEANDVTVTVAGGVFTVTDSGAPLTAGTNCTAVNANQATCTGPVDSARLGLEDLADRAQVSIGQTQSFISGGEGGDSLTGGPGFDGFDPGLGDDTVNGRGNFDFVGDNGSGDGADSIAGGSGFDSVGYDQHAGGVQVDTDGVGDDGEGCPGAGCEGDNVRADVESISGTEGDDTIRAGKAPNSIFAGGGEDTVVGGGGPDTVVGGEGDDTVRGGAGADRVVGSEGRDRELGGPGDDTVSSGFFDDEPDRISGGGGTDVVDYRGANSAVRVDLDGRPDDGVAGERDNVRTDIEDVFGSQFDDVLIGDSSANQLEGGLGNDRLLGGRGLDGLIGGDGGDRISGGAGRDLLEGGSGNDRLDARDRGPDQVECGAAFDRVNADRADRTTADCDRVRRR